MPCFLAVDLATEVDIVDLDAASAPSRRFMNPQEGHDVVLDPPGGCVGHANVALLLQGRDVVLDLGY